MASTRGTQGLKSQPLVPRHVPPEARYAAFPRHAGYIHALAHMCVDTLHTANRPGSMVFAAGGDYLIPRYACSPALLGEVVGENFRDHDMHPDALGNDCIPFACALLAIHRPRDD